MTTVGVAQTAAAKKTDVEHDGLKGKVKRITATDYTPVDKLGKITKGEEYPPSFGHTASEITVYNTSGYVVSIDVYGSWITIYKHDHYGRRIEENMYDTDDSTLVFKSIYQNDAKGNIIENKHYSDMELTFKYTYTYNEQGYMIESNCYQYSGHYESWSGRYYRDTVGTLSSKCICKYDDKNNLVETYNTIYENGVVSTINKSTYEYTKLDAHGNWAEKITYVGEANMPIVITERIIEYYE
ncbi:MAG: hypothetical protein LBP85_01325 [Prevotellaceae bacterium]|nr:hypothetical protein [Prevotellaceae bacterium]